MKKLTTLLLLFFCAIGFSQEQGIRLKTTPQVNPVLDSGYTENGEDCKYEHPIEQAFGGQGTSLESLFRSAVDIIVDPGETFTLNEIIIPVLIPAPEDPPAVAEIKYYNDVNGAPGEEIGSDYLEPTILNTVAWEDPDLVKYETKFELTPFTFEGDEENPTSYWIEIGIGSVNHSNNIYWEYTEGLGVYGEPFLIYSGHTGTWVLQEETREGGYEIFGDCGVLGVSENTLDGFSFYPNPTSDKLSLQAANNIDAVGIYNLLGQKVLEINVGATSSEINLSNLTTGTYIMEVTIEGQTGSYKIMKN